MGSPLSSFTIPALPLLHESPGSLVSEMLPARERSDMTADWVLGKATSVESPIPGPWNRLIGWSLLVGGLVSAPWLDVATISAVVGMAVLQVAVARALNLPAQTPLLQQPAAWLTGLGSLAYATGKTLLSSWSGRVWLVPAGALMCFAGFLLLLRREITFGAARERRVMLATISLAMLLAAAVELIGGSLYLTLGAPVGAEDDLRLRLLRLAQVGVTMLPALTLLHQGLAVKRKPDTGDLGWPLVCLSIGTLGMPAILAVAAVTHTGFKFLLPIPAIALFAGTTSALSLARRHGRPLERWGWCLIMLSMLGGLLMGLYAFDGPLPPPDFIGGYNDHVRRLIRLAHAAPIVLGVLGIVLSRELESSN